MLTVVLSIAALAPSPVEWVWEAPPGCPSQQVVERRFAALAPETCRGDQAGPLQVRALASRVDRRWALELELRRGERSVTRSLTARSCAALVEATAVIAATACPALSEEVTPAATPGTVPGAADALAAGTGESSLSPGPGDDLVPEPARLDPAPVVEPRRPRATDALAGPRAPVRRRGAAGLELGARLAAAWGPTPGPALLAGGTLRLQWPGVELLLAVDGGPRRRVGPSPGLGIDLRLVTATVAGCPALELGTGRRRGRLSLCLGVEGGVMMGTGVGTAVTRTAAQPWLAALFGPSLVWSLHARIGLGAGVDVAASLTRPAFVLDGYAFAVRAEELSVRLRTILTVRLR